MDYFFFIYISEKYLQFRKTQKHLLRKIFGSHHTSNLLTVEVFFKLCLSQRYVYHLERNWKNYVCIDVKNFANL